MMKQLIEHRMKRIADYTLSQLKSFDFGSYKDVAFKGERIPTLDEVLSLCLKYDKKLLIELKSELISKRDVIAGIFGRKESRCDTSSYTIF